MLAASPDSFVLLEPGTVLLPPPGISTDAGTHHETCCETGLAAVPARFVSVDVDAGLVEIETLGHEVFAPEQCAGIVHDTGAFPHQISSYRIRVWVKRSSLLSVTKKAFTGSDFELAAGLPVQVLDGGELSFGLYETTREFVLPPGSVVTGETYRASKWTKRDRIASKTESRLLLGAVGIVGDGGLIPLAAGEYWSSKSVTTSGSSAVVQVEARCARMRAAIPSSSLITIDAGEHEDSASIGLCAVVCNTEVRPGAPVFWPDGRLAGTTSGDGACGSRASWIVGDMKCFDVTLQNVDGSLPLCFRTRDLREGRMKVRGL